MGGLNSVADVLAVANADMAQQFAARRQDGLRIAAVGAGLLAADEQFGGPVEALNRQIGRAGRGFGCGDCFGRACRF